MINTRKMRLENVKAEADVVLKDNETRYLLGSSEGAR